MPADLTREEIAFVRDRGTAFATGDQLARIYAAAEAHLAEPARLAAARAEGVREGIEMAAKWHDAEAENASRATGRPGVSGSAMARLLTSIVLHQVSAEKIRALAPAPAEPPKALARCQAASLRNDGECVHPLCPVPHGSKGVARLICTLPGAGDDYVDEDNLPAAEAPTTPTVEASDGWVEWKGGNCPLPSDARADLRFRDGSERRTSLYATYRWQHVGKPDDIIAYRIVQPAEASAPVAEGCMCQKCGARYRVDVLVSDDVWARIADGRNMLCGQCIVDAIERDEFAAYRLVEVDAIAALEAESKALRERGALVVQALDGPGANAQLLVSAVDGLRALLQGQGGAS